MLKKLPAICLAASIGFTSIILAPIAAMAQTTTLTPAQVAAEFEKKYPATAAARAHPVQCPIVGDVVECPAPASKSTPTAAASKKTKPTVRTPAKQTEAQRRDAARQKGEVAEKKLSPASYRAQFTVAKPSHEGVIGGGGVVVTPANVKPAN